MQHDKMVVEYIVRWLSEPELWMPAIKDMSQYKDDINVRQEYSERGYEEYF